MKETIENGRLIKGECLAVMDKLIQEGVRVDAIICGLPYGTTAFKWDKPIALKPMWKLLRRILKPCGVITLFGGEPFSSQVRVSNLEMYKYDWKWHKDSGSSYANTVYQPSKDYEDIMVFSEGSASMESKTPMHYYPQKGAGYSGIRPLAVLQGFEKVIAKPPMVWKTEAEIQKFGAKKWVALLIKSNKAHPTQKPIDLLNYLIKTYTKENETVLDFTMGSGTTGIACKMLNRRFIGIELDKNYFKVATERIKKCTP